MPDTTDFNLRHAVYELGPQLPPPTSMPSGHNYRATRIWVLLDQLQIGATLQDAMKATDDMATALK